MLKAFIFECTSDQLTVRILLHSSASIFILMCVLFFLGGRRVIIQAVGAKQSPIKCFRRKGSYLQVWRSGFWSQLCPQLGQWLGGFLPSWSFSAASQLLTLTHHRKVSRALAFLEPNLSLWPLTNIFLCGSVGIKDMKSRKFRSQGSKGCYHIVISNKRTTQV